MDTEIALALARLSESADRLLATADGLDDAQAAAASRLPGWTRGHVLTHLARNRVRAAGRPAGLDDRPGQRRRA